jgi:uncharacterized protein (UPF0305 family)
MLNGYNPFRRQDNPHTAAGQIHSGIATLTSAQDRGELGAAIALIVLRYSPKDIGQMRRNFQEKIRDVTPEYRNRLQAKITEHLLGTWQTLRLMQQQGIFSAMNEPVPACVGTYWAMVATQCGSNREGDESRLCFLKYLIAGFCMFVQHEPGHPAGTPFPGGGTVQFIDGVYYCPVREKANDVDSALCPFCPALQTPAIGYLKPPVNPTEHQKQEFIRNCHDFHHFNG